MKVIGKIFLILLLLAIILAILFGGVLLFDRLQIINAQDYLDPVLTRVGLKKNTQPNIDSPTLLNQARFEKRLEAVALQQQQLQQQRQQLEQQQIELQERERKLGLLQQKLEQDRQFLTQQQQMYENKRKKQQQLARQLNNMPPQQAVAQMNAMDPVIVVDLLRQAEEIAAAEKTTSFVSYWLSLMEPGRAAELAELMIAKP